MKEVQGVSSPGFLFGPISIGNKFSHFKTKQGITFPIYVFLFQMETGIF